jgi:hypothetical protein
MQNNSEEVRRRMNNVPSVMALKDLVGGRGGRTQPTIYRVKREKSDLVQGAGKTGLTGLNYPRTAQKRIKLRRLIHHSGLI